jgi:hypothetical protein
MSTTQRKIDMQKLIGYFGVDSGQVMIGDPCYLNDFDRNEPNLTRIYKHTENGSVKVWPTDFSNYEEYKENGKTMNDLLHSGVYEEVPNEMDTSYSYRGACSVTLDSKNRAGMLGDGMAVVSSTGHGDGRYPVEADIQDGIIHSLTITFVEEN